MAGPRAIIHVDMDAFYAAIEQRDHPEWRGRPVVVGGIGKRSVVSTASYEARVFGVRSAMPGSVARRLCPDAVFVAPRMAHYAAVSREVFAVFERFTPIIESLSLDEAFLDVSASLSLFGSARAIGQAIKAGVREATGLSCSVGIAPNKLLAKLASELEKPDGLVELDHESAQARLERLPVGRLWTIGRVAEERLHALGIRTIGDLRRAPEAQVRRALGRHAATARRLARGEDERPVVPDRVERSIGAEHTFGDDLTRLEDARAWLLRLAERVGERARAEGLAARTVAVKLRAPPFETHTRQVTLPRATASTDAIFAAGEALLARWWSERRRPRLRLLGVTLAGLDAEPPIADLQPDLFASPRAPASGAPSAPDLALTSPRDDVADAINRRFGARTIKRAATLRAPSGDDPATTLRKR
jgi:DNA polymerase-4